MNRRSRRARESRPKKRAVCARCGGARRVQAVVQVGLVSWWTRPQMVVVPCPECAPIAERATA